MLIAGFLAPAVATGSNGNFDTIATVVITKALNSQPSDSYLRDIYQVTGNHPIWVGEHGLTNLGQQLLDKVASDSNVDNQTKMYRTLERIRAKSGSSSISKQISIEFEMSKLYRDYANYTVYGIINWPTFEVLLTRRVILEDVESAWETYPQVGIYSLLRNCIASGDLEGSFAPAVPRTQLYIKLEERLAEYKRLNANGEWPVIPAFNGLQPGQSNSAVPAIRKQLLLSGDLRGCGASSSDVYDNCLVDGIKHFQTRHGQNADGVIGKSTVNALRQSPTELITTMQLNLDRIKMMKRNDSGRHILINIPAFRLYFYENDEVIQTMKVITGTKKHPTPVFGNTAKTIVLNPYWNVPQSIIQKEMIPKLLRNSNAMSKENIEVRNGWGEGAQKISPSSVDWSQYRTSATVPFHFAQTPGAHNALGKVKFLFPNKHSVYMHDTPTKNLFSRDVRAFSHGCIRLEKPRELLKTFCTFNPEIDYAQAQKVLEGNTQVYHNLSNDVPVDVAYLTTWVDSDGLLQVRNDIYGYDSMQLEYRRKF
jgi:murein L,D-transpeptidase YcbB/YkuD